MSFKFLLNRLATAMVVVGIGMAVAGCATTGQDAAPEIAPNAEIEQAILDLDEARQLGAVWIVRDPAFDNKLVSLDEMLQRAQILHDRQQADAASALALRVSRFARLGVAQAAAAAGAEPYYPQ